MTLSVEGSDARAVAEETGPVRAVSPKLYGLVEIDAAGTVLYARIEPDGQRRRSDAPNYAGLNFYTEVAPFKNVAEFRQHLEDFGRGSQPVLSLNYICDYEDGPVCVRVLLARIRERTSMAETKSILIHIRRAQ